MDSRKLIGEDCMKILAEMPDADHEVLGSMTVHMGTHPKMGGARYCGYRV
ncbi:MAG: hypothetical protein ACJAS1_006095 [Oleiphilaceae bacterium]|jgi:hypothetical protein